MVIASSPVYFHDPIAVTDPVGGNSHVFILIGYQEGGTFTAVISVKAKNENKAREIKAEYASSSVPEVLRSCNQY